MNAVVCTLSTGQEVVLDADHWFTDWPETAHILPTAPQDVIWAWTYYGSSTRLEDMEPVVITRAFIVTSRLAAIVRPVQMGHLSFTKTVRMPSEEKTE